VNDDLIHIENLANTYNSHFVNLGPNLANKFEKQNVNFTKFLPKQHSSSLFFNPTNPNEIINITKDLKSSKSQGHDRISTSLLKQIIHSIVSPLNHIFNLSIATGIVPKSLKIAKVNPIFKKGDPHEISNYRPISILPSISKILEKIIYKRLYTFLDIYALLNLNQFGFRKHHSTDLALVQLYDKVTEAIANNKHVIGIFMDLSKAFDTIDHDILLKKLKVYGIRGVTLSWFRNYLLDRQQYVSVNGASSDLLTIQCGVPQGSILGPLLFLIYINDIINTSSLLSFILFADDTNIFYSHDQLDSLVHTLNQELPKVSTWFKCNKLSLNIEKTNFMHFKHTNARIIDFPYNIIIDDIPLERKQCTKFLGVFIDDQLNWNHHIGHITTCISRNIGILYKTRSYLPKSTLLMLYNSLLLPYMTYCNLIWASGGKTKINSIYLLQKKALRLCTGSHYLEHTYPLFSELKTLYIFDIDTLQSLIFMYKYKNKLLPESFKDFFTLNSDIHSYPTRNSQNFHLVNPRLLIAHTSIRHHGPDLWNTLPDNITSCHNLFAFKARIKKTTAISLH